MPEQWVELPISQPLFANADPDAVVNFNTALENCLQTEMGIVRFPGLADFADLGGKGRVYLHDFQGDLIAATSLGQVYRMDRAGTVSNVTGLPVAGGRRVVFAKSDRDLFMAAGGPIVRLRDRVTELLAASAPQAAHVAWIDNYTIAVEINSGRFFHSPPGEPATWNPLDTFAADGSPDNINSVVVTPFRELMLGGDQSVEQFERLPTGEIPFFRRWAVGDGFKLPYAVTYADNAVFAINSLNEMVRLSGQVPRSVSDAISLLLEGVDDWSDAWMSPQVNVLGQKLIIFQAPHATNSYGTKGLTLGYDLRQKRFTTLYGWDAGGSPARYPAWSYRRLWDRHFVGGEGKVYELTTRTYTNAGQTQRFMVRTAHMASGSGAIINDLRLRVRRGVGSQALDPKIGVRCSKNGEPFGANILKPLGKPGQRLQFLNYGSFGEALTFQFEISCTDDCPVDLMKVEMKSAPTGH